jgi:hypothetical protein
MASRLIVIKGYDRDKYLELKAEFSYCIGRGGTGKNVDFKVDPCEYLTSRQHFFVDFYPPHIFVRDNKSTNGTLIQRGNDIIPVTGMQTEIFDGDLIVAGNTVFRLEAVNEAHEMAQKPVSAPPVSPNAAEAAPEQHKPVTPQGYYSVVVPEIQLFHSAQVKCIACGELITVEISPSELQAYGYPVFMCGNCSSGFSDERNLKDLDSYGILQELKEDGIGLVYLARHKETGLLAEIRAILPRLLGEDILYLKREISVMQSVSHPNVVRMYESVVHRDRAYLIYEYMPEGDLNNYLKTTSGGSLSWNDACSVVCDVLSGLRHCHEMGIVHGDIKPANILFKRDPRGNPTARLGDLGLAWICDNMGLSGFSSEYREAQPFKAPELIENFRALKPAADIYSMGAILYFLLSGGLPYSSPTDAISQNSDISFDAKAIPPQDEDPDIPDALMRILKKATCREPESRFHNAAEMLQAILEMRL